MPTSGERRRRSGRDHGTQHPRPQQARPRRGAPGREHCRHEVVSRRGATGDPGATRPGGGPRLVRPRDAFTAAQAAAQRGTSSCCAMLTGSPWEEVAATAPGRHFFQIYPMGDRTWMSVIADRAEQAGFAATCVTVDSPVIGRRDRSLESGFAWAVPAEGTESLTRHGLITPTERPSPGPTSPGSVPTPHCPSSSRES